MPSFLFAKYIGRETNIVYLKNLIETSKVKTERYLIRQSNAKLNISIKNKLKKLKYRTRQIKATEKNK